MTAFDTHFPGGFPYPTLMRTPTGHPEAKRIRDELGAYILSVVETPPKTERKLYSFLLSDAELFTITREGRRTTYTPRREPRG